MGFVAGRGGVLMLALGLLGCGVARESQAPVELPHYTYRDDIEPLISKRCVTCHGAQRAEGRYRLDSWRALFGPGSDPERNAIPRFAQSRLLTMLGAANHRSALAPSEAEMLRSWVVVDAMAYFRSGYHPRGWLDPTTRDAPSFHGGALRAARWEVSPCQTCHGVDLRGGLSKVSCEGCHVGGPLASCESCHSGPSGGPDAPYFSDLRGELSAARGRAGAHRAHLNTQLAQPLVCDDCHLVPKSLDEWGHLFDDAATRRTDLRAELRFGARASTAGFVASSRREGETVRCTVYCHGGFSAAQRVDAEPAWQSKAPSKGCASCHAVPMHGIGGADCSLCHQQTVARCSIGSAGCCDVDGLGQTGQRFVDVALHLDGKVQVGKAGATIEGTCWACHGTAESNGAPAPDLEGRGDTSLVTVGMHALHIKDNALRKGIPCSTCHRMPDKVTDVGHVDSDRPAEVVFDSLADGTLRDPSITPTARWDRKTGTCSDVYCHARKDGKVGKVWSWTQRLAGGLVCDSCHKGHATYELTYCVVCHPAAFIGTAIDPATHMNGKLDFAW